ncbi:phosphoserine phosphatase SerB [Actimicrobium sp. CCI2.3]|uniref:phosphoserine phosphatase SerB n=1 Tax=Actimicrobium sp. CCI2.3 TaxID=3048616 RepID=UPI002AB35123|nr:phosphoserine phosphatase SerB [Actimicrobium sp. CCI2.3]MDY7574643.1 phosphoserine phosphatase SerB [Actimicrobium sp. CCI2.3]MEB0023995.1 phosphoserine phosphatase SerB [Actimicrobium sp. CCI2.3]
MNLILQGLTAQRHTIERIATLAGATGVVPLNASAFRCEGATLTTDIKAAIDTACLAAELDYAFVKAGQQLSDFKLLAMDMDSTLITIECIDEIADMQGLKPQVSVITEAAMRGELEFNESLTRRVALLAGLDASALQRVFDERLRLSPGAEKMLAAVKAAGLKTLLVSGGFTFFTERIKQQRGLDYAHANVLEIVDGKLTGRVVGGIVNAEEKKLTVARVCAELGVTPATAIVMGDGANDLQMMGIAGMSVAFRAKPVVRAQANVALNFVGLDGILNLFG